MREELAKNEYFYRIQVVQTALNRLSKRNGPLAAFKQDGKKVYVNRNFLFGSQQSHTIRRWMDTSALFFLWRVQELDTEASLRQFESRNC